MKKEYSKIKVRIVAYDVFKDAFNSSTPDNFVEDDLFVGVLEEEEVLK